MKKSPVIATRDYILFLRSDDYLLNSEVMEEAFKSLESDLDVYFFQRIQMGYCTNNGMRLLYKFYWSLYLPYKKARNFTKLRD